MKYHNWRHALNVAQTMFAMLKTAKMEKFMSDLEVSGVSGNDASRVFHRCNVVATCFQRSSDCWWRVCVTIWTIAVRTTLSKRKSNRRWPRCTRPARWSIITSTSASWYWTAKAITFFRFVRCGFDFTKPYHVEFILARVIRRLCRRKIIEPWWRLWRIRYCRPIWRCISKRKIVLWSWSRTANSVGKARTKKSVSCEGNAHSMLGDPLNGFFCRFSAVLCGILMSACDVSAIAKPWDIQHKMAKLVADEFFDQGDLEKLQLNEQPVVSVSNRVVLEQRAKQPAV